MENRQNHSHAFFIANDQTTFIRSKATSCVRCWRVAKMLAQAVAIITVAAWCFKLQMDVQNIQKEKHKVSEKISFIKIFCKYIKFYFRFRFFLFLYILYSYELWRENHEIPGFEIPKQYYSPLFPPKKKYFLSPIFGDLEISLILV